MRLVQQVLGSAIPLLANVAILLYVFQRFLAATRLRRKLAREMRDFATMVDRARDNLRYIGERVTRGMDEIEQDVGKELRVTGRLTTQSAKLAGVLRRFAGLEETVIELVRMDGNRENANVETPIDVSTEIEKVVAAAERRSVDGLRERRNAARERNEQQRDEEVKEEEPTTRNPLSKFSTCGAREMARKVRVATMPEVRLLGESRSSK
ncbi:uncharacterized protein LOC122531115 [Frieseomelitta varia]|uniref:uncharacterized protein LOC122531115 n=1 Tax=Frieseomelitta varia TaxID=561572 RepID=UPI001CB6AA26|nr:uncharacterized protein LOC122531115 [Frieseomelitta varia]